MEGLKHGGVCGYVLVSVVVTCVDLVLQFPIIMVLYASPMLLNVHLVTL